MTPPDSWLPTIQNVRRALESNGEVGTSDRAWTGPSEEDPTYRLLVDCNQLAVDIDNEIAVVHNFMRDKYRCAPAPCTWCLVYVLALKAAQETAAHRAFPCLAMHHLPHLPR